MKNDSNKVDFHSHFLSPSYYEYLRQYAGERPDNFDTPHWSEGHHIATMDKAGIAYALISVSSPNLAGADDAAEKDYARRINNEGAAFVSKYPTRLGLMAELPLPNIENALDEARYALAELKAVGFGLATHYRNKYLGCSDFDPLMAFLNDNGALVVVHPMKPYGHYEEVNNELPIPAFEFFVDTTRAFINMVLTGTFKRFPNIKWVFPHAGAFISLISDRIDSFATMMTLKNPALDLNFFNAMKNVYFDLAGFPLPKQLQILRKNVPVEHLVYGSDAPYTPDLVVMALTGALEKTNQLTEEEREKVFLRNAVNLIPQLSDIIGVPAAARSKLKYGGRFKRSHPWKRRLLSNLYLKMAAGRGNR